MNAPGFSTPEMEDVLHPANLVAAMLRFESSLARAQAAAGLIPSEAAAEIARACAEWQPEPGPILAATWKEGSPVISLVAGLRMRVSPESARWIHHGATSQDVVDTALVMIMKDGIAVLRSDLEVTCRRLVELTQSHRSTPMMGRTFLQLALPTTFGMRTALWLEPLVRINRELSSAHLPIQLGGPVGNLASAGAGGSALVAAVAMELGLEAPVVPWHTDRSHLTSAVETVAAMTTALGKIAGDLVLLASSDIGLVHMRPGRSSSMTGKANPLDAINALAAARACSGAAASVRNSHHELERGLGGWHLEWHAVPLVFHTAAATVVATTAALTSLEVDVAKMAAEAGELDQQMLAATSVWIDRVLAAAEPGVR